MKKLFSLLMLTMLCLGLQAESLPLSGVNRYAPWKYPLIAQFSSQWSTINLASIDFSAAEYYRYKIVFSQPAPKGIQLSIQNAAEASAYSGQYLPIDSGATVIEAEFNLDGFTDGDVYVTDFRLQSMDNQTKQVYIESVSLFNEYDEEFPQEPSSTGWNSGTATDPNGPFNFSAPSSWWGMTFYSQLGPWSGTVENGYVDRITLFATDTIPDNFVFAYRVTRALNDTTDTTINMEIPVEAKQGAKTFTFDIPESYSNLYFRYMGEGSQLFAIDSITRQQIYIPPFVYDVENTSAADDDPVFPTVDEASTIEKLTDPFEWSDGSGRVTEFKDWSKRRGEIAREIQHYEIGTKPAVDLNNVKASLVNDTLLVDITVGDSTLHMWSVINYPDSGQAPYPLIIGMNGNTGSLPSSLFAGKPIATMTFHSAQVNAYQQNSGQSREDRAGYEFVKLYPELIDNGAYAEWPWGVSRLIDGLQILGTDSTKIDMKHIGVTGCSYAGKMALFCGAFDERVALTIAQEPGGGGAAAWRVSHQGKGTAAWSNTFQKKGGVETLDATDYNWFKESLRDTYGQDNVYKLPYDHHELVAMICPRAVLMLGNPDYTWLADRSGYVSMNAARKVWEQFGIEDRCGFSIVGGHGHCSLPEVQYPEVTKFIDKFLLGQDTIDTEDVMISPDYKDNPEADPVTDYNTWIDWWGTSASPLLPRPNYHWYYIQAEDMTDGSYGTAWTFTEEPTCQNGAYMVSPNERISEVPADNAYILSKEFEVEELGDYYIYGLLNANGRTHDACWISFDDNTPSRVNGLNSDGEWTWKNLSKSIDDGTREDFKATLSPGTHRVNIYARDTEFKLDALCISNNDTLPDKTPTAIRTVEKSGPAKITVISSRDGVIIVGIETDEAFDGVVVNLFDEAGRKLFASGRVNVPQGRSTIALNARLPKGVYIVNVTSPRFATSKLMTN